MIPRVDWQKGRFKLSEFKLENGDIIAPFELSYMTAGTPKKNGSNVILFLPTASSTKDSAVAYVAKDAIFDPEQYFVIAIDTIGSGMSSRPSLIGGVDFPFYSIRDNARAVHLLITQELGLSWIKAAGGASMGAMIGLELALCFPAFVSGLYLWSPSSRCSAMFTAFNRLLGQIFTLDREFAGGRYSRQPAHALRVAGDSYFLALIGRGYLERLSASKAEASRRLIGEAFVDRWDANDLLSRYRSLTTHDVRDRPDGRHDEILAELETKCLLMPCPSDHLLPVEDALIMHSELKNSILKPIESDLGHWAASQPPDSWEYELMRAATLEFMSTL